MYGQKSMMSMDDTTMSWVAISWENEMSWKELLAIRIRQFERRPEDLELTLERLNVARLKNKGKFDKKHRVRPKKVTRWLCKTTISIINTIQWGCSRDIGSARKWWQAQRTTPPTKNKANELRYSRNNTKMSRASMTSEKINPTMSKWQIARVTTTTRGGKSKTNYLRPHHSCHK
mgnify:FL=1